ncbi:MAG: tRNA lysidine(34) synthetase TilS, partial [Bacteroidetes bacterium]|nr:tRNA lysidine(34) synthetase TilS [Bacteroidota bacterium]
PIYKYFSKNKNVKSFAFKNKMSIEEAGREIRYLELKNIAHKYSYNKIATAHNCGDNAETILLNLIKGTGIDGISGIPIERGNIIRPILCLQKENILKYLNKSVLNYRIDKSNLSNVYERNYIRNNILPLIKKNLNPNVEESIFKSSEVFKEVKALITNKLNEDFIKFVKTDKNKIKILLTNKANEKIKQLSFIIKDVVSKQFSEELNFKNVNDIVSLTNKRIGQKINLPGNLTAQKERGMILISRNSTKKNFVSLSLKPNDEIKLNFKRISIKKVKNLNNLIFTNNRNIELISGDKIKGSFKIRRWKDGDKFYPVGLNGTKKISDYLTEQKIPNYKKREQLVLTNNNKIVWVLGLRLDDRFKITSNTKKVYSICLK